MSEARLASRSWSVSTWLAVASLPFGGFALREVSPHSLAPGNPRLWEPPVSRWR